MQDDTAVPKPGAGSSPSAGVQVDLIALLVAAPNGNPVVLTVNEGDALPSGPFEQSHRSLQSGLRNWVEQQTGHPVGYIEQLYTFADRDRGSEEPKHRGISISYLGLSREEPSHRTPPGSWRNWYEFFPWEDHRLGAPQMIADVVEPELRAWAASAEQQERRQNRRRRAAGAFGFDGRLWNEEMVLQRYELLYEAGLVEEAVRATGATGVRTVPGRAMTGDHRRILATGIARLRTKIKYRPVVFELMPPAFTLLQLQRAVEALAGVTVHKQNFRRLIEQQDLVEETGQMSSDTGGRPAKLFRFRHAVLDERPVAGTK
ncbi:NUDIX hydrolase [Aminobacter sp. HY435]|uniref:NUDIX hydrolase n=1 Tax=Aminobacter sp. HY435 TaxID=2970917 RepID=UPI0022B9A459|nr:hypothetical protein [Aminobacter sp. HY435]